MSILSLEGLPPVVVPEIVNVWAAASSSAMKNDGLVGLVICDAVIAACAAEVTARPPTTSTATRTTGSKKRRRGPIWSPFDFSGGGSSHRPAPGVARRAGPG